jgi:hypothetical protein
MIVIMIHRSSIDDQCGQVLAGTQPVVSGVSGRNGFPIITVIKMNASCIIQRLSNQLVHYSFVTEGSTTNTY